MSRMSSANESDDGEDDATSWESLMGKKKINNNKDNAKRWPAFWHMDLNIVWTLYDLKFTEVFVLIIHGELKS